MAPPSSPQPYRIETAGVVERELDALEERAFAAGLGRQFSDAIDTIYRILKLYPEYGEIRQELKQPDGVYTWRALVVQPLFVEYIIDEGHRRVFLTTPIKAMPHSSFE